MHMTREQIRERINLLEALEGLSQAIDDMGDVEFRPGDSGTVDLNVACTSEVRGITFANSLPPEAVLAGLRAMARQIEESVMAAPRRPRADIPDPFADPIQLLMRQA